MSSITVAFITLACILTGLLVGLLARSRLPDHHVKDDSKDILKTATGMIATLAALVIGLLVSSAKSTLDAANAGITQSGARIIGLDCTLHRYGPETAEIRHFLRKSVEDSYHRIWPPPGGPPPRISTLREATDMEQLHEKIHALKPKDESQRDLQTQALQTCNELMQARWQMIEQSENPVPLPFLIILIFWLTVLFAGLGLLAPWNFTSVLALLVCAVSMSAAIMLILEMNSPLEGMIKVSGTPMQKAIDSLGK